jgi:hypothetical protein
MYSFCVRLYGVRKAERRTDESVAHLRGGSCSGLSSTALTGMIPPSIYLFRAADGRTIHADVNGSLNIMRKVVPTALTAERIEALVVAPVGLTIFTQPRQPSRLAS